MANSRSAAKRVRKTRKQTARNRVVRTRVKSSRKEVNEAIAAGDTAAAEKALVSFTSVVDKAASKNVVHKSSANRQKADLSRRVREVGAAKA